MQAGKQMETGRVLSGIASLARAHRAPLHAYAQLARAPLQVCVVDAPCRQVTLLLQAHHCTHALLGCGQEELASACLYLFNRPHASSRATKSALGSTLHCYRIQRLFQVRPWLVNKREDDVGKSIL